MKQVIEVLMYKASDGKFFADKSEAIKYQDQLNEVEACADTLFKNHLCPP